MTALAMVMTAADSVHSAPDRPEDEASTPLPVSTVQGVDGKTLALEAPDGGALVLVFLWTECPISNQYSPVLNGLVERFGPDRLRMIGLFVDADKTDSTVARHAETYLLTFPAARAGSVSIAKALGVETVPEAVVIDDQGTIRYQGRINDQFFSIGRKRPVVRSHDLRDAIEAVLQGEEVENPRTESVGCTLPDYGAQDDGR